MENQRKKGESSDTDNLEGLREGRSEVSPETSENFVVIPSKSLNLEATEKEDREQNVQTESSFQFYTPINPSKRPLGYNPDLVRQLPTNVQPNVHTLTPQTPRTIARRLMIQMKPENAINMITQIQQELAEATQQKDVFERKMNTLVNEATHRQAEKKAYLKQRDSYRTELARMKGARNQIEYATTRQLELELQARLDLQNRYDQTRGEIQQRTDEITFVETRLREEADEHMEVERLYAEDERVSKQELISSRDERDHMALQLRQLDKKAHQKRVEREALEKGLQQRKIEFQQKEKEMKDQIKKINERFDDLKDTKEENVGRQVRNQIARVIGEYSKELAKQTEDINILQRALIAKEGEIDNLMSYKKIDYGQRGTIIAPPTQAMMPSTESITQLEAGYTDRITPQYRDGSRYLKDSMSMTTNTEIETDSHVNGLPDREYVERGFDEHINGNLDDEDSDSLYMEMFANYEKFVEELFAKEGSSAEIPSYQEYLTLMIGETEIEDSDYPPKGKKTLQSRNDRHDKSSEKVNDRKPKKGVRDEKKRKGTGKDIDKLPRKGPSRRPDKDPDGDPDKNNKKGSKKGPNRNSKKGSGRGSDGRKPHKKPDDDPGDSPNPSDDDGDDEDDNDDDSDKENSGDYHNDDSDNDRHGRRKNVRKLNRNRERKVNNLKVMDGLPRKFDGSPKMDAKAFLRSMDDYFSLHQIKDDQVKIDRLKMTLENQARLWLDEEKEMMSYESLYTEFLKHFAGITSYEANLQKFRACTWNGTEPLENYKQRLLMLSEVIGNKTEDGMDYSREVKTQFKLGLPASFQMALGDLTEDADLEHTLKRAQKVWDLQKFQELKAGKVTIGDTSSGVTMKATSKQTEDDLVETVKNVMEQEVGKAFLAVTSNQYDGYRDGYDRGRLMYRDRTLSPAYDKLSSNYRDRNDSRTRYRDYSRDSRGRFVSNRRIDGYNDQARSSFNRSRNISRDPYDRYERYRQRSYSRDGRDDSGDYRRRFYNDNYRNRSISRSRDSSRDPNFRDRNRSQSRDGNFRIPYSNPIKDRSRSRSKSKEDDPISNKPQCYFCHSESHFFRDCAKLKDYMQDKVLITDNQSFQ